MDIKETREFTLEIGNDELSERAKRWAARAEADCVSDLPGQLKFKRGSFWHFGFNPRKLIPCEVVVAHAPDEEGRIVCTVYWNHIFVMTTRFMRSLVADEADLLVAYLKGAL